MDSRSFSGFQSPSMDKDELISIDVRISKDGLKSNVTVEQKLRHIWRCLLRSEEMGKMLVDEIAKMRNQHSEEMDEIGKNMAHVRSISEGRDKAMVQMKNENTKLKAQMNEMELKVAQVDLGFADRIKNILTVEGMIDSEENGIERQIRELIKELKNCQTELKKVQEDNLLLQKTNLNLTNSSKLKEAKEKDHENEIRQLKEELFMTAGEKEKNHGIELQSLKDSKAKWERDFIESDKKSKELQEAVNELRKQIDVERINHQHEVQEITKTFEGELLKAVEMHENDIKSEDHEKETEQIANRKLLDNSKLEVDYRMLQLQVSKFEEEHKRLQEVVRATEEEKSELKGDLTELRSINEQSAAEIVSAKELAGKDIASMKKSFAKEKGEIESSYVLKVEELSKRNKLLSNQLKEKEDKVYEITKHVKDLEIKIDELKSKLVVKEEEKGKEFENSVEKELKLQSLQNQLNDLLAQKIGYESIVVSQEKQSTDHKKKISDITKRYDDLESLFKMTEEHKIDLGKKLINATGELASSQEYINQLKDEIKSLTSQITRHQDLSINEQEKFQAMVNKLKEEIEIERERRKQEQKKFDDLNRSAYDENNELKNTVNDVKLDSKDLADKLRRSLQMESELKTQLDVESRLRADLEEKVSEQEEELERCQLKHIELTETLKASREINSNYEKESDLKGQMLNQSENVLNQREMDMTSLKDLINQLKSQLNRSENKNNDYKYEMGIMKERMKQLEYQIDNYKILQNDLLIKIDENEIMKEQLQQQNESRKLQSDAIVEFQKQLMLLESRTADYEMENENLSTLVEEKDELLYQLKQKHKTVRKEHGQSGDRAKALDTRVKDLTKENEVLKLEFLSTNEVLDELRRKHEEQTISNENKIQSLGDRYVRERHAFETLTSQLRNNLEISQEKLQKEADWKNSTENSFKQMKKEKAELVSKVASLQESISSQALDQRRIKLRIEHLEKENTDLRDSIGKLKSEKFNLEKINRELENQIAYDPYEGNASTNQITRRDFDQRGKQHERKFMNGDIGFLQTTKKQNSFIGNRPSYGR